MTHAEFARLAAAHGFSRVYFLAPGKYALGENPHRLCADVPAEYPFASSVCCLVYPYSPFTADERIPAYYLASNKAYFGMKSLLAELAALGIRAEKVEIPLKQALEEAGIGVELKTSLRAIPPYGTRVVLMTVAVGGIPPLGYDERISFPCAACRACEKACPFGAPGENGLDLARCMRLRMETADHDDCIREKQITFIGCEICQYACPMNAKLEKAVPGEEASAAFDIHRLIDGETKAARALVGKNMTSGGKLTAEALAFAARDGLLPEEELREAIRRADDSPFSAVRSAARYAAVKILEKHKEAEDL